jgi:subtilisin family serine protease
MSLGGSKSTAVNAAAAGVVAAGVFLAVAAGNEAQSAANVSPASEPSVFTVGATDSSDAFASFSNYGSLVDGNAPGVSILSTWKNGGTVSDTARHDLIANANTASRTPSQEPLWLLPMSPVSVLTFWVLRASRPLLLLPAAFRLYPPRARSPASSLEPPTPSSTTAMAHKPVFSSLLMFSM